MTWFLYYFRVNSFIIYGGIVLFLGRLSFSWKEKLVFRVIFKIDFSDFLSWGRSVVGVENTRLVTLLFGDAEKV